MKMAKIAYLPEFGKGLEMGRRLLAQNGPDNVAEIAGEIPDGAILTAATMVGFNTLALGMLKGTPDKSRAALVQALVDMGLLNRA